MTTVTLYSEADMTHYTSADFAEEFEFQDSNDDPVDMTGSTFAMDIKTAPGAAASLSLTTANGGIASTDLTNGTITINVADNALSADTYVYDLIRIYGSPAEREILLRGSFIVATGVTVA